MTLTAGIEIFGPKKNLGIHLGPFLNFFIFWTFLCVQKKRSIGKLRLSLVSSFDSHGWNEKFWTSKKFLGINLWPLWNFLIFKLFFVSIQKMENWETQVQLGWQFWLSWLELKFMGLKDLRYAFMTLLKLFYFTNFSSC